MKFISVHIFSRMCFAGLAVFVFSFPFIGNAQETREVNISLGPPTFDFEVTRGQVIEDKLVIVNRSEEAIPFKLAVRNWTAKGETGDIEFFEDPSATLGFNTRAWITLSKENIVLAGGEKQVIPFTVTVPKNAEPGGHYAIINFESLVPQEALKEGKPIILPQIGSLLFFSVLVPDIEFKSEPLIVREFTIPQQEVRRPLAFLEPVPVVRAVSRLTFIDQALRSLFLRVSNEDIVHHKIKGEVQILNSRGSLVARFPVSPITVLPGKTRSVPIALKEIAFQGGAGEAESETIASRITEQLVLGKYTALVRLGEDGGQVISAEVSVWAFPWKLALIAGVLGFILFFFVIKWRMRFIFACRALLGKSKSSDKLKK